eukprot:CAMPEP_0181327220 /NCGR_PEP_ID=MMETSP1101-20121128/21969_1 /TAXON_ID=46948 /ORGANISM="Rhodomonas abbreviata, Strain Caron Lab Isolate" /LENGTH=82 /DNA_ID=CAMNT_0023435833 /DNA_START=31 /DNA_END=279 /DNA_ORIENTATION=-
MTFNILAQRAPAQQQTPTAKVAAAAAPTSTKLAPTACYQRANQHVSSCHGAMAAMGISVGKNGQLVITNKNRFTTSKEPSQV